MIVRCDQCQTRFKIPDEKVTEKGVKVRCTKCQNTFRVRKQPSEVAGAAAAPAPAAPKPPPPTPFGEPLTDPFAAFGPAGEPSGDATRPGFFAAGIEATRQPVSPSFEAQADLPRELFDGPTRVAPLPPSLHVATGRPLPHSSATRERPEVTDPLAPSFSDAPKEKSPLWAAPPQPPPPAPPPRPAAPPPAPPAPAPIQAQAPSAPGRLDDVPALDEPLASPASEPLGGNGVLPASGAREALFDMPPPRPNGRAEELAAGASAPTEQHAVMQRAASVPIEKPSAVVPMGLGELEPPSAARKVTGVVVNVTLAALLLVGLLAAGSAALNEGRVDFSLERLKATFAAERALVAVDLSNGLYETRAGKPVFFVRGEIENRSDRPARVRVRAEILERGQLVRAAESFAGPTPTPEELYAIASSSDVDALNRRVKEAPAVAPGQRQPFLVTFYEYPPDLHGFRVKVVATELAAETAAR